MTEFGFATPKHTTTTPTGVSDDGDLDAASDTEYEVERIVSAERIGNKYKMWIKWVGYDDITPRWRHELVKECSNAELLRDIDAAVQAARERYNAEHGYVEDDADDEGPTASDAPSLVVNSPPPAVPTGTHPADDNRPLSLRRPKRHKQLVVQPIDGTAARIAFARLRSFTKYNDVHSLLAVCDDAALLRPMSTFAC
jgi:hypothetical protein